jgi:hypothetical protein
MCYVPILSKKLLESGALYDLSVLYDNLCYVLQTRECCLKIVERDWLFTRPSEYNTTVCAVVCYILKYCNM